MKILMIFDQIQAGFGGKEKGDLELGGKKMPIGSANMFEKYLPEVDGQIIGTLYCGDDFYLKNKETVTRKLVAMTKKLSPDVVICGPAFNYEKYGLLCSEVGYAIENQLNIPVVAAMSVECEEAINAHKADLTIVKMPKKGGIGLTDSLKKILELGALKAANKPIDDFVKENCY
ncbi:GrdB-related putative oxidoreductase [Candidatus Enterococcus murrayae]|uniref:Glycine/betaine/sarcosine/D-proline family reductase selenoprotein B n=1 Tax=Candidatus Enterococcus murrayae TaxID=2815321 RepID=A0ABS3HDE9_9ENTE|nr:GrdB-related putative oxidoreductase [Enterococcus sp. MJM16]MBO0451482.1 glycine/betaine/sarcosine/D-proline family reductase selenoprotein B [Enterococcus sp. MJM16]